MAYAPRRKQWLRLLLPLGDGRDVVDEAGRAAPRRARRGAAQARAAAVAARVAPEVVAGAHVSQNGKTRVAASRRPRAASTNYEGAPRAAVEHGARLPRARASYAHGAARAAPLTPGAAATITGVAAIIKTGTTKTTCYKNILGHHIIRK